MTRFLLRQQKLRITFGAPSSPPVVCPQRKAATARWLGAVVGLNPQGRDQTQEYQGIAGPLCLFPAWALSPQSWRHGQHPATENNVPFTPCSVWLVLTAILRGAFVSPDGFVHSSGHGWGAFALGDASRLVVTGS